MTVQSYIQLNWIDERLKWNAADFVGVTKSYASTDELWIPDITIYNS